MRKTTKFEDNQTQKQIALLKDSDVFEHAEAGGLCLISDYKTRKKFWRASQKVIKYPDNTVLPALLTVGVIRKNPGSVIRLITASNTNANNGINI